MALEYNKKLTSRAQELRKNRTKEENLLWYHFLCRYPLRFRRQHPIGNFIVDFYCYKAKLVVELDGSQHYTTDGMQYDAERTAYLEGVGLQVLRFSNSDVMHRFSGVCDAIDQAVKSRVYDPLPPKTPSPEEKVARRQPGRKRFGDSVR